MILIANTVNDNGDKSIRAISFTIKDTLWACFRLHRCRCTKDKCTKRHQNYSIYKAGIREFNSELDCISIVKSIRRFNLLLSSSACLSDNEDVAKMQIQTIKANVDFKKICKSQSLPNTKIITN